MNKSTKKYFHFIYIIYDFKQLFFNISNLYFEIHILD